jgi:hypothetical protein
VEDFEELGDYGWEGRLRGDEEEDGVAAVFEAEGPGGGGDVVASCLRRFGVSHKSLKYVAQSIPF